MKIELIEITIKELFENYKDDQEGGVKGFNNKLNIRPPYQREFIYKDEQKKAVIDTIKKGFPLNVMYWSVVNEKEFELIDGQQRTISICQFLEEDFSFEGKYFDNLFDDEKEKILNYKITVYLCTGTEKEKLEWFKTINIAGEKLTEQELRNAVYSGTWVTDAKRYFSKTNCAAYLLANEYLNGIPIRQDYLETVIKWKSNNEINDYMAKNQKKENADELWLYFQEVINWVKKIFKIYRKEMKGLEWGLIYEKYKELEIDPELLEEKISELMSDEEITNQKGIYMYVLSGEEKYLNLRKFNDKQKRVIYEKQKGYCPFCNKKFNLDEMDADHKKPWSKGGTTTTENCQLLCRVCNIKKSNK